MLALPASVLASASAAPQPLLEQLAASAPTPLSLDDLAARVGCDPELLRRVAHRRQALPLQFVGPIARELGVSSAEVEVAAGRVLSLGRTVGQRVARGLPPDRLAGEPLYLRPVRPTVAPVFGA